MNGKDLEKGLQPLVAVKAKESITSSAKLTFCVAVNVLATVGIVYVNKSIFENKSFKRCPSSFVAFHFITTGIMLYIASRPQMGIFTPARTSVTSVLPLAMIMCANVVLVNLSLAHSSIVLYQIVRVLLTPLTAVLNFCFYGSRISLLAALSILPACAGVGLVSYYDSLPATAGAVVKETSATGVIFAFSGLTTSAVYTLWVSQYHRKLTMTSTQLLFNQMPIGVLILAVVSLFTDTFPVWSEVLPRQWLLLFLSGFCACIVNLSQFFIINIAGPVSCTVVGHLKTCFIVGLGWMTSKRTVDKGSIFGISLALSGVILYSVSEYRVQLKPAR